jgi:hypothetical protein
MVLGAEAEPHPEILQPEEMRLRMDRAAAAAGLDLLELAKWAVMDFRAQF